MPKPTKKKALPTSRAELLDAFKDYEGIEAFDRALDSPEGPGSLPILLKGDPEHACPSSGHQAMVTPKDTSCRKCGRPVRYWYVRHVNTKQKGRIAAIKHKAMVPVRIEELLNPDEIADMVQNSPDGLVHTGTNGALVLYKIPLALRNIRMTAQKQALDKRRKNPKLVREDLAAEAGRAEGFGAEAADAIYGGLEYSAKAHRTTLADEAAALGEDE
jgi:hypothetical protein